jgi:dipeptide/tripeptide permease
MKSESILSKNFGFTLVLLSAAYICLSPMNALAAAGTPAIACNILLAYMEGSFGALVAAAAGVGAIIAAAVGSFKAAWALLVVSIGSFILRSYLTLYNGSCLG